MYDQSIDRQLRESLAAPVPSLPSDFANRVAREARRQETNVQRYRAPFFLLYGALSAAVSAALMRSQGLDWTVVAAATGGALAVLPVLTRSLRWK